MDDKQGPAGHGGSGEDHYQPWLRNSGRNGSQPRDGAPRDAAARPAPLPTLSKAVVERADDPAPPLRPARLSVDELLSRPVPVPTQPPAPLSMIDNLSRSVAASTTAVRDALQNGGVRDAVARLELPRRTAAAARLLGRTTQRAAEATVRGTRATGAALAPVMAQAGRALGNGTQQAGTALAGSARKLAALSRDGVEAAREALAARGQADAPAAPESQLDRLLGETAAEAPAMPKSAASASAADAALPLFAAPGSDAAPAPRGRRKATAAAPAAETASDAMMAAAAGAGDDRSPMPGAIGGGGGGRLPGSAGGGAGAGQSWWRHPATLALGGAFLLSSGFAAGLYWTGPGVDRATTEQVVRDYILQNPEILPQAMARLEANRSAEVVGRLRSRIEEPFSGAWAGAADGDVVLTVFTDYACTFCKASMPDIERLLREDSRVKVVFRELPILSEDSEPAARLALAAARRGRYMPMHRALFEARSPDAAARTAAAERLGVAAGSAVLGDAAITRELQSNLALARELGFNGTPSWVVGDRLLTGAVGYQQLRDAVEQAREG